MMKFTVEIDSNFNIEISSFIEIMNEQVLSDPDFIMGMASDKSYNDDRVVQINYLERQKIMNNTVYLLVGGDRGMVIDEIHGVYDSKEMAETQYDILDETIAIPNYELWITEQTMNPEYEDNRNK